jgi:NADPH:quinone reductase-like Zn-dependent oxidoreductase
MKLFMPLKFPAILGCDLAGEVVELGNGCHRLKVGDRVFAMMPHDWGAQAELVAVPEELVGLKPEKMSMEEAAGVGAVAITAVHALRDLAKVKAGQEVLINGASGGVGMFSVQVAKALGARVTAVCSAASFEVVKGLGADELIDYKTTDFTRSDKRWDVVFDTIGNHPYAHCKRVMRGKWAHVETMPTGRTFMRSLLNPFFAGRVLAIVAKSTPDRIAFIQKLLEEGKMKTIVDKVFPPSAIVEAHAYSKSGRAKGKIVLKFAA